MGVPPYDTVTPSGWPLSLWTLVMCFYQTTFPFNEGPAMCARFRVQRDWYHGGLGMFCLGRRSPCSGLRFPHRKCGQIQAARVKGGVSFPLVTVSSLWCGETEP